MIKIDMENCTGCGACVQNCPVNCITWEKKEFDFRYPIVDKNICIDCGKCERICPIEKKQKNLLYQKAYAVVHKDKNILENSTSGGAFTALAQYILEQKGIVYGCSMEKEHQVCHIRVQNDTELKKLRGSKYVESDTGNIYQQVLTDLKNDKKVLFTGTPCQVAGLYGFLNKKYENLYTVDIVCHGVGSQGYFSKFAKYLEKKKMVKEILFRSKKYGGWSCSVGAVKVLDEQKKELHLKPFYEYKNYYYYYFLRGDVYRQSCYQCKYANLKRQGDFTLGDFWGIEKLDISFSTERGCSLVLVNNERAQNIFDRISSLYKKEVNIEQAVKRNQQLSKPSEKSKIRSELIRQYEEMNAEAIQEIFFIKNYKQVCKGFVKSLVPYKVKRILRGKR